MVEAKGQPATVGEISESPTDRIAKDRARRLHAAALEAEVAAYITVHVGELDKRARRPVVRHRRAEPQQVAASADVEEVVAPRVNNKEG